MSKKPSRYAKAIAAYYARLKEFDFQGALHEGAVSEAFQVLLNEAGRLHKWTLIPQLTEKGIRPDGTLKDFMNLVRGHWEAKDSADNLATEIQKKIKKGYPLGNIIFEDSRRAVLYQNKQATMDVDLTEADQLANLLDAFFKHTEPQIEGFEAAITEFNDRVASLPSCASR